MLCYVGVLEKVPHFLIKCINTNTVTLNHTNFSVYSDMTLLFVLCHDGSLSTQSENMFL